MSPIELQKLKIKNGYTDLMLACLAEDLTLVKKLIREGADINAKDYSNYSVLTVALDSNFRIIDELINSGVDLESFDRLGNTALIHSVIRNDFKLVEKLVQKGADINSSVTKTCISEGNVETLTWFLNKGADPNSVNGLSMLELSSARDDINIMKTLIDYGADAKRHHPLMYAASFQRTEMVKLLLDNGADINQMDFEGQTPLINSLGKDKSSETAIYLIEVGADIYIKDLKGKDALAYAAKYGINDVICLLENNSLLDLTKVNSDNSIAPGKSSNANRIRI